MLITSELQITKLKVSVLWFHRLVHQSLVHDQLERGWAGLHSTNQLAYTAELFVSIVDGGESPVERILEQLDRFHREVNRACAVATHSWDYLCHFVHDGKVDKQGAILGAHERRDAPDAMVQVKHVCTK